MSGNIIKKQSFNNSSTWITTDNTDNIKPGNHILIYINNQNREIKYNNGEKFIVINVGKKSIHIKGLLNYKKKYGENFISAKWIKNIDVKHYTGSTIAKSGYNEEDNIINDLNENKYGMRDKFIKITINDSIDEFYKLKGNTKVDISNGNINAQVKKFLNEGFGQLDRHWVKDLIKNIPELKIIESILIGLCELPVCAENNKKCDKSKSVKKLSKEHYSEDDLNLFTKTIDHCKKKILEYVFLGKEPKTVPDYIIGVQYIDNIRKKITIYKLSDIINILMKEEFKIRKSETVFELGKTLSFQRKGGDNGNISSNQIQCKFCFGKFINLYDSKILDKVIINL